MEKTPAPTGRLTAKKLMEWVNKELIRLEMVNFEVYKIERTHYTSDQYQGGACKLHCWFRDKRFPKDSTIDRMNYFMCFYFIGEYQEYLNSGYELTLQFAYRSSRTLVTQLEIQPKKK